MNNIEKNKLIVDFLYPDWIHPKDRMKKDEDWKKYEIPENEAKKYGGWAVYTYLILEDYDRFNYNTSWSSLIPVVSKIVTLCNGHSSLSTTYNTLWACIRTDDIDGAFETVVNFLIDNKTYIKKWNKANKDLV